MQTNMFDEQAKDWDTSERTNRAKALADCMREDISSGGVAVEFGCGTGLLSRQLLKSFDTIYCIDKSTGMLAELSSVLLREGITNIVVAENELLSSDNMLDSVDYVYSSMVFHHLDDIVAELSVLRNVLKNKGKLIIFDLDEGRDKFHGPEEIVNVLGKEELTQILTEVGFTDIKFSTAYKGTRVQNGLPYSLYKCVCVNNKY